MTDDTLQRKGRPKVTAWQKQHAVETIKAMAVDGVAPSRAEWMKRTGSGDTWLMRATGTTCWLDALAVLGLKSKRVQSARYGVGSGRPSSGKPCHQDPSHPSPLAGDKFCALCHDRWGQLGITDGARVGRTRRA